MKNKIVLWGNDADESRIIVTLELQQEENKVMIWKFPEAIATEALYKNLTFGWKDGKEEFIMPEGVIEINRKLTLTDSLLPEEIKVDKPDIITRRQNEWHFIVLSAKLNQVYRAELDEFKEKVESMTSYDQGVWNKLKDFWAKVSEQRNERNLLSDHANSLKTGVNKLFDKLKEYRTVLDAEFKNLASANYEKLGETLGEIESKIEKNEKLRSTFDELRSFQKNLTSSKLTQDLRSKLWKRMDAAFKSLKEKRFGPQGAPNASPSNHLENRKTGLLKAIEKMKISIERDKKEMSFQEKKMGSSDTGQLEHQIREVRAKMIRDRVNSKEEKLADMLKTEIELNQKIERQQIKDVKRVENEKKNAVKKELEAKIAAEIKEKQEARKDEDEKLSKAAEAIVEGKKSSKKQKTEAKAEETTEEAKSEKGVLETITDAVTSIKEKVEDKMAQAAEILEEKTDEVLSSQGEDPAESTGITGKLAKAAGIAAGGLSSAIGDFVEKAEDKTAELLTSAAETIDNLTEKGVETIEDLTSTKEETAETKETVEEPMASSESPEEESKGFFDSISDAVSSVADEVSDKVKQAADFVEAKADEVLENQGDDGEESGGLMDKLTKAAGAATAGLTDVVGDMVDQASEALGDLTEKGKEIVDNMSNEEKSDDSSDDSKKA